MASRSDSEGAAAKRARQCDGDAGRGGPPLKQARQRDPSASLLLERLDDALIVRVLLFLRPPTVLGAVVRTCARLREAALAGWAYRRPLAPRTPRQLAMLFERVGGPGTDRARALASCFSALQLRNVLDSVRDATLEGVTRMQTLRALDLARAQGVTDAGLSAMALSGGLERLERLSLAETAAGDGCVAAVAAGLPALRALALDRCEAVTPAGLGALGAALVELSLEGCRAAIDQSVAAVAAAAPRLERLNLAYCERVSDAGVEALAPLAGTLVELQLFGCASVRSAAHLARLTRLEVLDLESCGGIEDFSPLGALTAMRCLDLSDTAVTGAMLVAMRGMRHLERLDLDLCESLADAGLLALADFPSLTDLDLSCCPRITDDGLDALAALPRISILKMENVSQNDAVSADHLDLLRDALPDTCELWYT